MTNLRAMLMDQGAQGLENWTLIGADSLSLDQGVDGLTVSGWGFTTDDPDPTEKNTAWVVTGLTEITPVAEPIPLPALGPVGLAGVIALLLAGGSLPLSLRGR